MEMEHDKGKKSQSASRLKDLLGHYKLLIFPETKSLAEQPIFSFLTADFKVHKKFRPFNASVLGGDVSKGSSRKFY